MDTYKQLFINFMLSQTTPAFNWQNVTNPDIQFNGLSYEDFLTQLNDEADIFAAKFVQQ